MSDETNALATIPEAGAYLPADPEMLGILKENLGGQSIDPSMLVQVKAPAGGGKHFTVQTIDGEVTTEAIVGVITLWQTQRMRWASGDPDGSPPLCVSRDGEIGRGDNGTRPADNAKAEAAGWELRYTPDGVDVWSGTHNCATCPLSKMGSAEGGGAGQGCTEKRLLYVRGQDSLLPIAVNVAPTSIRNYTEYSLRLAAGTTPYYGAVTELTLEPTKNSAGKPYSKIKFRRARGMAPEEVQSMREYRAAIVPVLQSTLLTDGEYVTPASVLDALEDA